MNYRIRRAIADDAASCVEIRGLTRENPVSVAGLKSRGVSVESWAEGIRDQSLPGWICEFDDKIIGYCFGSADSGEIVVLALLPGHEFQGIGKRLLSTMVNELAALGHRRLFLGCSTDPGVRSHGFYRHLGWRSTGALDAGGDEILEYFLTEYHPDSENQ